LKGRDFQSRPQGPKYQTDLGNHKILANIDLAQMAANFAFRAHELREIRLMVLDQRAGIWRLGMSFLAAADERVLDVPIGDDTLTVPPARRPGVDTAE
jgi:hypothetical protein